MNKTFDKISILLIEDNPLQFDDLSATEGNITLNIEGESFSGFYDLKLFQHPLEVKEFLVNYQYLLDNYSQEEIGSTNGIVPQVIVFDYKLSDNIGIDRNKGSLHYNTTTKGLREKLNPNYLIKKLLHKKGIEIKIELDDIDRYNKLDFIRSINGLVGTQTIKEEIRSQDQRVLGDDDEKPGDDEFGLYCGITVWDLFKSDPTVCIPATQNKNTIGQLNTYSKFYEWLYEAELKDMFLESNRGDKTWDKIIPKAMFHLRNRILELAKRGYVVFDINNICELISCKTFDALTNLPFFIKTQYGEKSYSAKAIFCDYFVQAQFEKVKEYCNVILTEVLFIQDLEQLERIAKEFNHIWEGYSTQFGDRIKLSTLYMLERLGKPKDDELYMTLKDKYPMSEGSKPSFKDIISIFESTLKDDKEKRLVLYMLATKATLNLNSNLSEFKRRKNISNGAYHISDFTVLNDEDFSYVFSPIFTEYPHSPYALTMHIDTILRKAEKNKLTKTFAGLNSLGLIETKEKGDKLKVNKMLTTSIKPGEKIFLLTYFKRELNTLKRKEIASLPDWLK